MGSRTKRHAAAAAVAIGMMSPALQAGELSINTVDLGWYRSTGVHEAYNQNTLTGHLDVEYRSFYLWDVPQVQGTVTAARVEFEIEYSLGQYGSVPQTGRAFDLDPANLQFVTLNNGGGHGTEIFADLGSGLIYADLVVPRAPIGTWDFTVTMTLNANALAAINASAGGRFALGIVNTTPSTSDYFLFSSMSARAEQNLVLTVSEVPEPTSALLLAFGLAGVMRYARVGRCKNPRRD